MAPLLAPILAQVVTLNLGDRTEERRVSSQARGTPAYFETDTRPSAGLDFGFRHSSITITYAPSLTLTPGPSGARELVVFNTISLVGTYRFRQSTLSLYDSVGFGERNLGAEVVAGARTTPNTTPPATGGSGTPAPPGMPAPGGAPTAGTQAQGAPIATLNRVVRLETFTTGAHLAHELSRSLSLGADASYLVTGGADAASRATYPLFQGPRLALTLGDQLTQRDLLTTTYSFQYGWSVGGPHAWIMQESLALTHQLAKRSGVRAGAGLSFSRDAEPNGLIAYSIYPTFDLGAYYGFLLARGEFTFNASVAIAPVLDPVAVAVDPRLTPTVGVSWTRDRFFSSVTSSAATSIGNPTYQGGISALYGAARVGYQVSKLLSVDGGVRGAWQRFHGQVVLPFTWAAFVGVNLALPVPIAGHK